MVTLNVRHKRQRVAATSRGENHCVCTGRVLSCTRAVCCVCHLNLLAGVFQPLLACSRSILSVVD